MRTINPQLLQSKIGLAPYNILVTPWGNFADKTVNGAEGRILELGSLNDVLTTDSTSTNVNVKLDDSDGYLGTILEHQDIHKQTVRIYQAFDNPEFNSPFLIFQGQISSPITWNEGERTLSFEIMNVIEDFETGFSAEDGQFQFLHESLVGQPWPLAFGTVRYSQCLPLQIMPTTITLEAFGITDIGLIEQIIRARFQLSSYQADTLASAYELRQFGLALLAQVAIAHFQGDEQNSEALLQIALADQEQANQMDQSVSDQSRSVQQQIAILYETLNDQNKYDIFDSAKLIPEMGAYARGLKAKKPIKIQIGDQFPSSGTYTIRINGTIFEAKITVANIGDQEGEVHLTYVPQQIQTPIKMATVEYETIGNRPVLSTLDWSISGGGAFKQGFQYFPPGSKIEIISEYPLSHVANIIPSKILGVYAYRSFNGLRKLSLVPPEHYTVTIGTPGASTAHDPITSPIPNVPFVTFNKTTFYGTFPYRTTKPLSGNLNRFINEFEQSSANAYVPQIRGAGWFQPTIVTLNRPLSTIAYIYDLELTRINDILTSYRSNRLLQAVPSRVLPLEEWEDDIYVLMESSIGPNVVDVLTWLIKVYTFKGIDDDSFNHVKTLTNNAPVNFVLTDRQNVLTLLNDIAMQAMCSIYLKEDIFFLKYLPEKSDPVDTIVASDILANSLSIIGSETENLVTRYTAIWRKDYTPNFKPNRVVLKSNILKYGLHAEEKDYYIYNRYDLVKASVSFWMFRKSNSWKHITFKTSINKLNLETFDSVSINLPGYHISISPVVGIIESAVYDSENNEITFSVWMPVRLGEMIEYPLAYPANVTETDVYPTQFDITSGGGTGSLFDFTPGRLPNFNGLTPTNDGGYGGVIEDVPGGQKLGVYDYFSGYVTQGIPATTSSPGVPISIPVNYNDVNIPSLPTTEAPNYNYNLKDPKIIPFAAKPVESGSNADSSVYPGKVTGGSGDTYQVDIYKAGISGKAMNVKVTQLQIDPAETIPINSWVIVVKNNKVNSDGTKEEVYYMQVPVWVNE